MGPWTGSIIVIDSLLISFLLDIAMTNIFSSVIYFGSSRFSMKIVTWSTKCQALIAELSSSPFCCQRLVKRQV